MSDLHLSYRVSNMQPSATLGMAQAARDLASKGIDVAILSAGEPNFDTPRSIGEVAKASINQGKTHYVPVRGTKSMIAAMQEKFLRDQRISYGADEVLCTVGAKSAIALALAAIVNDGDEVIVCAPYWVSYVEQIRLAGGVPVIVATQLINNLMPIKKDLLKAITPKTKAIIINSPNNPTGAVISKEQLQDLAEVLFGSSLWLISDEIYERLLFDDYVHYSPASLSDDMRQRTIVISGVSKAYAMTGWRVGVVAGAKSIIAGMTDLQGQGVTCLPEFIQDAAAFALKEPDEVRADMRQMLQAYKERRDYALELFKQLPKVTVFKPQGAFYLWVDFSYYMGAMVAHKRITSDIDLATRMLAEAHVATVPGTPFGGEGCIRFSIASAKSDIEKAISRCKTWLGNA